MQVPRKRQDRTVVITLSVFLTALAGFLLAEHLAGSGLPSQAGYLRALTVYVLAVCAIRLAAYGIFRVFLPAIKTSTPRIVEDVTVAGGAIVWSFIWLQENGVNLSSLIATSAVLTAVIGFSLQDTLGNILGGMALQFDQSIRVGDWIMLDNLRGRVTEIGWRHTAVETPAWETVIVPNSVLVKNRVTVLGRKEGEPLQWRRMIYFNVDFRYSPTQVIDIVQNAVRLAEIERVASDPEPVCLLADFAESYCRYVVAFWLTDPGPAGPTDSRVREHIYFALKREGIPLSIPAQAIFLTQETDERKAHKAEQALAQRVSALRRLELFEGLSPEELQRVAERLVPAPFTAGDVMTRQGAAAHWLYILIDGHVDVLVEGPGQRPVRVAELGPGSFFGEMGLMTGEPRSATVLARTDVECYRLDKEAFQDIIRSRPAIAEEISLVLARRRTELESVLENLDAEARARRLTSARRDMLHRVRSFFGLESGA